MNGWIGSQAVILHQIDRPAAVAREAVAHPFAWRADAVMKAASATLSACTLSDHNDRCRCCRLAAVTRPISHEAGALLEQIATTIGSLGLVSECMCECHLGNV